MAIESSHADFPRLLLSLLKAVVVVAAVVVEVVLVQCDATATDSDG